LSKADRSINEATFSTNCVSRLDSNLAAVTSGRSTSTQRRRTTCTLRTCIGGLHVDSPAVGKFTVATLDCEIAPTASFRKTALDTNMAAFVGGISTLRSTAHEVNFAAISSVAVKCVRPFTAGNVHRTAGRLAS